MASPILRCRLAPEHLAALDQRAAALGATRSDLARSLIVIGLEATGDGDAIPIELLPTMNWKSAAARLQVLGPVRWTSGDPQLDDLLGEGDDLLGEG
jgi:hypothetical protein